MLAFPALGREPRRQSRQRGRRHAKLKISSAFTHGVASGEPGPDSMTFWTRYVDDGHAAVPLQLELATNARMTDGRIVAETTTDPKRDFTARTTVSGLSPAATYHYRWLGPDNSQSPPGQTRTLPAAGTPQLRIGVFACTNASQGWFNAYAHAAVANDIDLALHLGNYLCLPPQGTVAATLAGRADAQPANPLTRADHWAHYRAVRSDPDLQAMHARHPFIALFDDHRLDAGLSAEAAAAALGAWRDWLPVSDARFARYPLGSLGVLYRLDTHMPGRDPSLDPTAATRAADPLAMLARLRDDGWVEGSRQFLGRDQESWLLATMAADARLGLRRQILAQAAMMARLLMPTDAEMFASPAVRPDIHTAALLGKAGLPMRLTGWDGYPAARARILATARHQAVDLVSLAAGRHNGWASNLTSDDQPAGVEFAVQSVTMPGLEADFPGSADKLGAALMRANPDLRFTDLSQRGYMHLLLTPSQTVCEWRFTQPVRSHSNQLAAVARARTALLERKIVMG